MQSRINSQSALIRKKVNEYNSLCDTGPYPTQQFPDTIDVNHYLKPKSSKLSTKKEMIQAAHKRHRAIEEETLVKEDMVLTVSFCQDQQQKLVSEINRLKGLGVLSQFEIGSITCLRDELLGVECFLKRSEELFHVVKDSLPYIQYSILNEQGVYDPLQSFTNTELQDIEQMLHEYSENTTCSDIESSDEDDDIDV